jgi:uncharacterized protein (DUF608 family)
LSSLQNAVGWDGRSAIDGLSNAGYGGNLNLAQRFGDAEGVLLINGELADDHPSQGVMALAGIGGKVASLAQWNSLSTLWREFEGTGRLPVRGVLGPSERGKTVNTAITQRVELAPGEQETVKAVIAWHFPNRYVDYAQWEKLIPRDKSRFFLGNAYAKRGSPTEWLPEFIANLDELKGKTAAYAKAVFDADLPEPIRGAVGANVANLRTNVCMRTEDGRFHGFEGAHGASTWEGVHSSGGCCPMNCTHVWNYEQALNEL